MSITKHNMKRTRKMKIMSKGCKKESFPEVKCTKNISSFSSSLFFHSFVGLLSLAMSRFGWDRNKYCYNFSFLSRVFLFFWILFFVVAFLLSFYFIFYSQDDWITSKYFFYGRGMKMRACSIFALKNLK
jgi:hypothetical protein